MGQAAIRLAGPFLEQTLRELRGLMDFPAARTQVAAQVQRHGPGAGIEPQEWQKRRRGFLGGTFR